MRFARCTAIACCLAGSVALVGCKSDDEKMLEKQDKMASPAMNNADKMIADGQAMKDKGTMMKQNGMTAQGDKMVMEGDKLIMDGQKLKEKVMAK